MQTLDKTEKTCQRQTLQLFGLSVSDKGKKGLITFIPGTCMIKLFMTVINYVA